jgi:hypothetical protein
VTTIDKNTELEAMISDFARRSGDQLRFAVKGPKGYSTTWTAFGRGNDYYIGARPFMGSTKISLHASGICRVALTAHQYSSMASEGLLQPLDRAFVKWKRAPTPDHGGNLVASIIFPGEHLVLEEPSGTYRKPLVHFGEVPVGKAFEFGFFYSKQPLTDLGDISLNMGKPLASTQLADGTIVSIAARMIDFDRSNLPADDAINSASKQILSRDALSIVEERRNLTAHFWNSPADGEALRMYEIGGVRLLAPTPIEIDAPLAGET